MNRRFISRLVLFIVILALPGLACQAVTGFFELRDQPKITPSPLPEKPAAGTTTTIEPPQEVPATKAVLCPPITGEILEAGTQFYDEGVDNEKHEEPEELYLVTYSVSGDRISNPLYEEVSADLTPYQEDAATQQAIWDYFTALLPARGRASLAEYSIVTDGVGNLLADVGQTSYDPALWSLEVDIRDASDRLNLTYTLIHEYAHLLTLGPEQVMPSVAVFKHPDDDGVYYNEVNSCPEYFPGEGCSRSDSYINAFYNSYWSDIYAEWQAINLVEDDDIYYDALDDFYHKYQDRFVTNYAATDPEEDIAETFTFFVLSDRPNGDTIAEQKTLFFYQYPELVQLRIEILSRLCQLNQ